jgi:hypothetical protein
MKSFDPKKNNRTYEFIVHHLNFDIESEFLYHAMKFQNSMDPRTYQQEKNIKVGFVDNLFV